MTKIRVAKSHESFFQSYAVGINSKRSSNVGHIDPSREGILQVIDVEMDDFKERGVLEDLLELKEMIWQSIHTGGIQSKRTLAGEIKPLW